MKRCLLVCSLVLVFALLLSACAADFEAAPMADMALPAAESPAFDMDVADDSAEPDEESAPAPESVMEAEAPAEEAFYDWDDDVVMDSIEMVLEEWDDIVIEIDIESPFRTPDPDASPASAIEDYTEENPAPLPIITPDDPRGRRLTYTVHADLQTTSFSEKTNLIAIVAAEEGGFVLQSSMQGGDLRDTETVTERRAFYEIRLPTENLPGFLVAIRQNFYVVNLIQYSEDITVEYERETWEIEDLTELEEWLEEALEDDDLDAAERRDLEVYLADVRSDIREAQQRHSAMEYDILYSSVNIWIEEVIFEVDEDDEDYYVNGEDDETTFGDRFGQAAATSFGGFVGFFQGLLIVIITILPTLLILAAITALIIFAVRRRKKWRAANPKKENVLPPSNHVNNHDMNSNAYWNYNNNPNNTYNNIQNAPNTPPSTNAPDNQNENNIG